jgi:hypothetical protein
LNNPSRKHAHTLFVFKKSIKLENHIFSEDGVYIKAVVNDMIDKIDNGDKLPSIMGTAVFWGIAVAGGSKLASKSSTKKKLFKKPAVANP